MKVIILLFIFSINLRPAAAVNKKKVIKINYLNTIFGHLHRNPSRYSSSLTTISCNHPIKIYQVTSKKGMAVVLFNNTWHFAKVGPYEGYIDKKFLSDKKVDCFQDKYPKFFNGLELDLTELYYWGRLYDQYVYGKSKVQ